MELLLITTHYCMKTEEQKWIILEPIWMIPPPTICCLFKITTIVIIINETAKWLVIITLSHVWSKQCARAGVKVLLGLQTVDSLATRSKAVFFAFTFVLHNVQSHSSTRSGVCLFSWIMHNFSECQILWSLCYLVFHALTLKMPIQTSLSVVPELPVSLRSGEKFMKTSTPHADINCIFWIFVDAKDKDKDQ